MLPRRQLLRAGLAAGSAILWPAGALRRAAAAEPPFGLEQLRERARALAAQPFVEPDDRLPAALRELDAARYHALRFRPERALWRGETLFEVQLLHRGHHFARRVPVHLIEDAAPRTPAFDPALFDYAHSGLEAPPEGDLGFAGFRLHYPLHRPDYADDLMVFLGASYFRVLGRNQHYGISARGLAIDTALPGGEEFPFFRAFWLEKPAPGATRMTLFALLDSPSVTGAYRFAVAPGAATAVEVTATLYPRREIAKLGIAPLTSMFLFGETRSRRFDDHRPEVHDSDGLLLHGASGEWIWRPLTNPAALQVSAYLDENLRGFGLLQRDRAFASYQDLDMEYHRRPSLWVEPSRDWGPGQVELVEIPSDSEVNDNVVAYWVPRRAAVPGEALDFAYRLHCHLDHPLRPPGGRVEATRLGDAPGSEGERLFVVDFAGGELAGLAAAQPVGAGVTASAGRIDSVAVRKNPETGGWRLSFLYRPETARAADLRAYLRLRGDALTETWSFLWKS